MKQLNKISKIIKNSILLFKEALLTSIQTFTSIFNMKKIKSSDIDSYLTVKIETSNEATGPYIYKIFFKPPEHLLFHVLDVINSPFFYKIINEITKKGPDLILSFQFISNISVGDKQRIFEHNHQQIIEDLNKPSTINKVDNIINSISNTLNNKILDSYSTDLISLSTINIIVTKRSKHFYLKDFEYHLRHN